jgi:hypothetical protein
MLVQEQKQGHAGFQKICRERMTKCMRTGLLGNLRFFYRLLDSALQ